MKKIIVTFFALLLLNGCATIVGDKTQRVQLDSEPKGAEFIVEDENGVVVAKGITPQGVVLEKSAGGYFDKKSYEITFQNKGVTPVKIPLKASVNGWYIGGNLVFGGLIGWLIVDPMNGAMYTLHPEKVNAVFNE